MLLDIFWNGISWTWLFPQLRGLVLVSLKDEKFAEALQHEIGVRPLNTPRTCIRAIRMFIACVTPHCTGFGVLTTTLFAIWPERWNWCLNSARGRVLHRQLGRQPIGHGSALMSDKLARPMARSGSFQAAERGRRLDRRDASRVVRQQ